MSSPTLTRQRLTTLFLLACLALLFPLVATFELTDGDFPRLYLYLFGVWAAIIALAAWTTHR